jgi:hypothetical protein
VAYMNCTQGAEAQPDLADFDGLDAPCRFAEERAVTVKHIRDARQAAGEHVVEKGNASPA